MEEHLEHGAGAWTWTRGFDFVFGRDRPRGSGLRRDPVQGHYSSTGRQNIPSLVPLPSVDTRDPETLNGGRARFKRVQKKEPISVVVCRLG